MSLATAFAAASPRVAPPPVPWPARAIHGAVAAALVLLLARALGAGAWAWSVGIVYIAYDTLLLLFVGWQAAALAFRLPPTASPRSASRPTLGVIIATHNEATALPITLAALAAQTDPPDAILIADDGSTDATADMLAGHALATPALGAVAVSATDPALRWLRLPHAGKAAALNAALPRIETDIVLTVDADTLLDPGAIAAMRAAFADPALVAATGILVPVCGPGLGARLFQWFQTYEYVRNFIARFAWARADALLLISGAFAGFRREALLAVGGFDPACMTEDYELIHRLRRHAGDHGLDWRTTVVGTARARTDAPETLGAFLRQRRRWFGGFLQTQYWYRAMAGDRRYGAVGLAMLPVKAIDAVQPLYALTAIALLAGFVVTGRLDALAPAAGLVTAKIAFDLAFYLFAIALYRKLVPGPDRPGFALALLTAIVEPFTFQVLRHVGAALGWASALARRQHWGTQSRAGLRALGNHGHIHAIQPVPNLENPS